MASEPTINRWTRFVALGEIHGVTRVIPANDRLHWDYLPGETSCKVEPLTTSVQIYSYGRHFPLARFVPKTKKSPALFVINGDRWGGGGWSRTGQHQSEIRSAIRQVTIDAAKFGEVIESILIPFSALEGAGIDFDSIRPIHVREDRTQVIARSSRYLQDVPRWQRTRTEYDTRSASVESLKRDGAPGHTRNRHFQRYVDLSGSGYFDPANGEIQTRSIGDNEYRVRVTFPPNAEPGSPCWTHWDMLGDENGNVSWRVPREVPNVTPDENGIYHWDERRHWLGDSLFTAEVSRTDTTLIVTPSREVADASGGHIGYRSSNIGERYVIGRNDKVTKTRYRFLSSFDYNEPAPLYFLAALPHSSNAATVDEAYADLMPRSVAAAIAAGKDVIRQGDIFAVETTLTKEEVYSRAVRRSRRSVANGNGAARPGEVNAEDASRVVAIFGTAHTATEVAVTPEGVTYIRGRIYHDPARRNWNGRLLRDHVTRQLGDGDKTWYVAIRNTVPRLRPNRTIEIVRTIADIGMYDNAATATN